MQVHMLTILQSNADEEVFFLVIDFHSGLVAQDKYLLQWSLDDCLQPRETKRLRERERNFPFHLPPH